MLFFMAVGTHQGRGHVQLLMIAAMAVAAVDRIVTAGMAAGAPVGDYARCDTLVALHAQFAIEYAAYAVG